ncbi:hypothetical protein ABZ896_40530 [Streptomyces sp. NPDC047072]|uniref:hypothetical protein n=1 Tax=Streptomyces sp. NPDC047072 TaxID=3154809 RepID=UPI0033EF635E
MPSSVRAELHELVLRIRTDRAGATGFAAGVFHLDRQSGRGDLERGRTGLFHLLRATPELAEAWIENRGRHGVVVLGRRTLFERLSRDWLVVPVVEQAREVLGSGVVAGFGVGVSARSAVALAERAVARAASEHRPCGYLMEDSGLVIGPIGAAGHLSSPSMPGRDEHVRELARTVGLSSATLSRLAAIERDLAGRLVTPSELADAMAVTDPSGRRLVRKLHAHGLVTSEGLAATPHGAGRVPGRDGTASRCSPP